MPPEGWRRTGACIGMGLRHQCITACRGYCLHPLEGAVAHVRVEWLSLSRGDSFGGLSKATTLSSAAVAVGLNRPARALDKLDVREPRSDCRGSDLNFPIDVVAVAPVSLSRSPKAWPRRPRFRRRSPVCMCRMLASTAGTNLLKGSRFKNSVACL